MDATSAGRAPGRNDESGFTFVEVLLTIALLSIGFVAVLGALSTMIVAGSTHEKLSTSENAVRSLAEFVKSNAAESNPWKGCADGPLTAYQQRVADAFVPPNGYAAAVTDVRYWEGSGPTGFGPTCNDAAVQLVTVQINSTSGSVVQTIEVVKRP